MILTVLLVLPMVRLTMPPMVGMMLDSLNNKKDSLRLPSLTGK